MESILIKNPVCLETTSGIKADLNTLDDIKEVSLLNRFTKDRRNNEEVVYEFTKDPALLHQYFAIREYVYKNVQKEMNFEDFSEEESFYDETGMILIARKGKECIGGVRLNYRTPENPIPLSEEDEGFVFSDVYPLNPLQDSYAEISRMVMMPGHDTYEHTKTFTRMLHEKCIELKIEYVFVLSTIVNARNFRKMARGHGYDCTLFSDIKIPHRKIFRDTKFYLLCSRVAKTAKREFPSDILLDSKKAEANKKLA
jgi:hypothetical protein